MPERTTLGTRGLISVFLLVATAASGRIGETLEQCITRYGSYWTESPGVSLGLYLFHTYADRRQARDPFYVTVSIGDGTVAAIWYIKKQNWVTEGALPLTEI
jgi:hypothetical protein